MYSPSPYHEGRQVKQNMRIVLDTALNPGEAEYKNFGDVAMLQVAVRRLIELFPAASIEVLTESPENLKKYCPGAVPLPRIGRNLWVGESFLFGRFRTYFPFPLKTWLDRTAVILESRYPAFLRRAVSLRLSIRDDENIKGDLLTFLKAMESADLLLICGAGGFADGTRRWDMPILGVLHTAIRRGILAVMMGQGMGPLNDSEVLSRMRSVFPSLKLITLRGGRGGRHLIESLGVSPERILTTGDEAIDLVYESRAEEPGNGLGVNLRVAPYAGVGKDMIEKLRPVLQDFARRHHAPMVPLPIAFHRLASDHETIRQLVTGFNDFSDGGASLDTPLDVIRQAGQCRIVVTGAYHAAVFALAQGIPVVCLAMSPYYAAKFLGLEDQFGTGCETVFLDDPDATGRLHAAMERAWKSVETVRQPLLQAALRQLESSRNAYLRVRDFMEHIQQDGFDGQRPEKKSIAASH